ncbi:unnamed protein product [Acanthoscelides obtectus]|uniref:Uncharacterized protein n=1 Tax=Acanthoscelides obtectus TaxID=200917 RepID=A0A9P0PM41_ACAOB|nr:unnamed protein product [Acanthoscelides obtectus]CAK1681638.1 hypothetical protein AOBTE_LOCUS33182 [Acanthoscelides obtectus]
MGPSFVENWTLLDDCLFIKGCKCIRKREHSVYLCLRFCLTRRNSS